MRYILYRCHNYFNLWQLPGIQDSVRLNGNKILTELVSLDTPGKATVEVVIVADPDQHEICFVGDEAFKELSQVNPLQK